MTTTIHYNISKENRAKLFSAYMKLYYAFVSKHLANGNILGQSQYNAICDDMLNFLGDRVNQIYTPAIAYITHFFLSKHKPSVLRQSVISKHANETRFVAKIDADNDIMAATKELEEQISAVNFVAKIDADNDIMTATKELEEQISAVNAVTDNTQTQNNVPFSTIPRPNGHCQTFQEWLRLVETSPNLNKMANDPDGFAKLYRKFIMERGTPQQ